MVVLIRTLAVMMTAAASLPAQQVGERLPTDFVIERLDGTQVSLADSRGSVRIVNVWASWCRPCVAELPSLAAMADSLADAGVTVYAVALDRSRQRLVNFLRRLAAAPEVYVERQSFPREWGRWALPMTWIIGPDDRLLHIHRGAARWDEPAVLASLRLMVENAR